MSNKLGELNTAENVNLDGEIGRLTNNLSILNRELELFNEGKSRYSSVYPIMDQIEFNEKRLMAAKVKKEIQIIKPYLSSEGIELNRKYRSDGITCRLAKFEDKRYLEYMLLLTQPSDNNIEQYTGLEGIIIFDINGNILYHHNYPAISDKHKKLCEKGKEQYTEIDPSELFLVDDNVLLEIDDKQLIKKLKSTNN